MNMPKEIKLGIHDSEGNQLTVTVINQPMNGILNKDNDQTNNIFTYTLTKIL